MGFAFRAEWLPAAALAALWFPLFALWRHAWRAEPEQAFGWGVPVLALYLAWKRSRRRPAPRPGSGKMAWTTVALGFLLFLATLPVLEANTLWPTAQWAGAAAAGGITLADLAIAGGTPWVLHFAFPVAFLSTALTWPTPLQAWIVAHLAKSNAQMAAEVVSAMGYPAVVNGSVIVVTNGFVGITEACSGLRSFQAVWMAAWFLGEIFHLNWPRRFGLVGAALGAALANNLLRTIFLTWEAAARGLAESERWHDAAGVAELLLTLFLVGLGAVCLQGRAASRAEISAPAPLGGALRLWSGLVLAGAVAAEGATQAWYFAHERGAKDRLHWELTAPSPAWRDVPLPPRMRLVLDYSEGKGLTWRDPQTGASISAFLVSWHGEAANGENPEWHDPAICLPASGAKLAARLGEFTIPIGVVPVRFTGYRFIVAGQPIQVFFCHWDAELGRERGEGRAQEFDLRERRLQRVYEGRRQSDVAHLIFVIPERNDAAALAWLREWAPRLLHPHYLALGVERLRNQLCKESIATMPPTEDVSKRPKSEGTTYSSQSRRRS